MKIGQTFASAELPSLPLSPLRRPAVSLNSLGGKIAELD
jgi:hypothetical protein